MWDFLECFKSKGLFHRGNLFVCRKVTDLWNYKNNTTKSLTGLHALNWLRLLLWTSSLTHKEIRGLILCQVNNLFISKHIYLKRRSSRLITNLLNQRMAQCCSMSHLLPGEALAASSCSAVGSELLMLPEQRGQGFGAQGTQPWASSSCLNILQIEPEACLQLGRLLG